jgi:hypothetical protein
MKLLSLGCRPCISFMHNIVKAYTYIHTCMHAYMRARTHTHTHREMMKKASVEALFSPHTVLSGVVRNCLNIIWSIPQSEQRSEFGK